MLARISALCLAFLVTVACAAADASPSSHGAKPDVEVEILVPIGLLPFERAALEVAAREWNLALAGVHRFDIGVLGDLPKPNAVAVRGVEPVESDCAEGGCALARAIVCGHDVQVIHGRVTPANAAKVIMHELGHILCMPHIDIETSLMAPYATDKQGQCIDPATLLLLAVVRDDFDFGRFKPTCPARSASATSAPSSEDTRRSAPRPLDRW
jgi:hypothetical protein